MLGRQEDYAAKRRFRNHVIFGLPNQIFHSPLREVAPSTMTNEKYDLANGKWKTATPQYIPSLLTRQQRWRGAGERFAFPRRYPGGAARPRPHAPIAVACGSGSSIRLSIPRPFLTASRES